MISILYLCKILTKRLNNNHKKQQELIIVKHLKINYNNNFVKMKAVMIIDIMEIIKIQLIRIIMNNAL